MIVVRQSIHFMQPFEGRVFCCGIRGHSMSDLNPIFTHFVFELSIKWLIKFSWNTYFILLIFSGTKQVQSFFEVLQDTDRTNLEYLGTKMANCLITGSPKYLSESAERWHNSHILWNVSFHFTRRNKLFNLPIVYFTYKQRQFKILMRFKEKMKVEWRSKGQREYSWLWGI